MGFTTLRDPAELLGGYATVALREAINRGVVEGPRILTAGPILTTTGGHADFWPLWINRDDMPTVTQVDGVEECRKAVRERVKMGTDWIKIFGSGGIMDSYSKCEFADDELKVIVEEAHAKERLVSAHLMYSEGVRACVKAGVDTVEHGSILTDECIELMLENKTVLVPTLFAVWSITKRGKEFGLTDEYIETSTKNLFEPHIKSFRKAYEAGVKLAMGTDCGFQPCPHGTNAKELELMMEFSDMSAMEAIQITTKNAAEALRIDDQVGTITEGKIADLIVIDGNPLKDICILQDKSKILMVMKEGLSQIDGGLSL
jgi:imidazolonepropionase-like amidohydrolase